MKVVLLKSIDKLGQAGEAVDVKRGYYRNFLGPRGFALEATKQNLTLVESKKKKLEAMVAREQTDAEQIKSQLEGKELTFELRANDQGQLFGSVTQRDIADAIKESFNVEIERRKIEIGHLKSLGPHPVKLRVYPGVVATITVTVERLLTEEEKAEIEAAKEAAEKAAQKRAEREAAAAEAEAAGEATEAEATEEVVASAEGEKTEE